MTSEHTKKYFYAVKEYPDDIIITFDDDFIYRDFIVATLYKSYIAHPDCVSAMRVHKMVFTQDGSPIPYNSWESECRNAEGIESHLWFATGVGGVLYPPHCLSGEVFNLEALRKLSFMNDDVWLKFMEVMKGTKVVPAYETGKVQGRQIYGSQDFALWKTNVTGGENDVQIQAVLEHYSGWRDEKGRTLLEVIREDQA